MPRVLRTNPSRESQTPMKRCKRTTNALIAKATKESSKCTKLLIAADTGCKPTKPTDICLKTPVKRRQATLVSRYFGAPPDDDPTCGHPPESIEEYCADALARCNVLDMTDVPSPALYYVTLLRELSEVKPLLIQEELHHNPWKLLIAVFFLNKTTGRLAIPIFRKVIDRWPSPDALSQASTSEIVPIITTLGLQRKRAELLIKFSQQYIHRPPHPDVLQRTKAHLANVSDDFTGRFMDRSCQPYDACAAISHFSGVGAYALDSYRIFCLPGDAWRDARPGDKELIRYLRWRWAFEAHMRWDPIYGAIGPAEPGYILSLLYYLKATTTCPAAPTL